jgi:hypothetical protein
MSCVLVQARSMCCFVSFGCVHVFGVGFLSTFMLPPSPLRLVQLRRRDTHVRCLVSSRGIRHRCAARPGEAAQQQRLRAGRELVPGCDDGGRASSARQVSDLSLAARLSLPPSSTSTRLCTLSIVGGLHYLCVACASMHAVTWWATCGSPVGTSRSGSWSCFSRQTRSMAAASRRACRSTGSLWHTPRLACEPPLGSGKSPPSCHCGRVGRRPRTHCGGQTPPPPIPMQRLPRHNLSTMHYKFCTREGTRLQNNTQRTCEQHDNPAKPAGRRHTTIKISHNRTHHPLADCPAHRHPRRPHVCAMLARPH